MAEIKKLKEAVDDVNSAIKETRAFVKAISDAMIKFNSYISSTGEDLKSSAESKISSYITAQAPSRISLDNDTAGSIAEKIATKKAFELKTLLVTTVNNSIDSLIIGPIKFVVNGIGDSLKSILSFLSPPETPNPFKVMYDMAVSRALMYKSLTENFLNSI